MCGAVFVLVFAFLCLPGPSCTNSDNMALLLGTLKMMQRATCDDEIVSLACPRGTAISIQVAQYGKASSGGHSCVENSRSQSIAVEVEGEKDCLWPNTMQYSLLQRVVEACQKKPQCKFSTKPKIGLVDPCPRTRKFVEVAYKCRPFTFRSRTCCEDDVIKLSCNPYSRIAIFDAQYGRTAYESITCQQTQGVLDETCSAPHGTDTVMQICHGKRRCQIEASNKTFGSPCKSQTRTYLKVVYACVPLGVLTERYESAAETDEVLNGDKKSDGDEQSLFDDSDGASDRWDDLNAVSPVVNPALQPPDDVYASATSTQKNEESFMKTTQKSPVNNNAGLSNQKTVLFIYVSAGILIFIIIVLLLVAIRCYMTRRSSENSKTGDMFTTEAPNVFSDAVSDIDNDVDVSHISGTFYDPIHPDMILYRDNPANKGTLRAMRPLSTIYPCAGTSMYGNVDYVPSQGREGTNRFRGKDEEPDAMMSPKSLGTYSNSQFYYG
ncbi:protein eva-1-like [Achroia grisella]|uniref:protein eva-1-like n=1 Tax=Achroia grisella TaxID=688607 RepID=UPI0027D2E228|nr:protein eva-1-like [Achroia grisella]